MNLAHFASNRLTSDMFVSNLPDELRCLICFDVLDDPQQCPNGHMFCGLCIKKSLQQKAECPNCSHQLGKDGTGLSKCLFVKLMIEKLEVRCRSFNPKMSNNCIWCGPLHERALHSLVCVKRRVICDLCQESCVFDFLEEHKLSECSKRRTVTCKICQEAFFQNLIADHKKECNKKKQKEELKLRRREAQEKKSAERLQSDVVKESAKVLEAELRMSLPMCPLAALSCCTSSCQGRIRDVSAHVGKMLGFREVAQKLFQKVLDLEEENTSLKASLSALNGKQLLQKLRVPSAQAVSSATGDSATAFQSNKPQPQKQQQPTVSAFEQASQQYVHHAKQKSTRKREIFATSTALQQGFAHASTNIFSSLSHLAHDDDGDDSDEGCVQQAPLPPVPPLLVASMTKNDHEKYTLAVQTATKEGFAGAASKSFTATADCSLSGKQQRQQQWQQQWQQQESTESFADENTHLSAETALPHVVTTATTSSGVVSTAAAITEHTPPVVKPEDHPADGSVVAVPPPPPLLISQAVQAAPSMQPSSLPTTPLLTSLEVDAIIAGNMWTLVRSDTWSPLPYMTPEQRTSPTMSPPVTMGSPTDTKEKTSFGAASQVPTSPTKPCKPMGTKEAAPWIPPAPWTPDTPWIPCCDLMATDSAGCATVDVMAVKRSEAAETAHSRNSLMSPTDFSDGSSGMALKALASPPRKTSCDPMASGTVVAVESATAAVASVVMTSSDISYVAQQVQQQEQLEQQYTAPVMNFAAIYERPLCIPGTHPVVNLVYEQGPFVGCVYSGDLAHNGERHGYGTLLFPDGMQYCGDWLHDQKCGTGVVTFPDGSSCSGSWIRDLQDGWVTHTMADGTMGTALWKEDVQVGPMVLH